MFSQATFLFTPLSIPNFRFLALVCKHHATEDLSFVLLFVTITLKGDDKGHLLKRLYVTYQSINNLLELLFPGVCVHPRSYRPFRLFNVLMLVSLS